MILAVAALLFQVSPVAQVLPFETPAPVSVAVRANAAPQALVAKNNDVTPSANVSLPKAPVNPASNAAPDPLRADSLDTSGGDSLPIVDTPEPPIGKPVHYDVERLPSRRNWLILSLADHGAAAFDAYATRDAISHGAHEENPFLAPAANSNAIYAVSQVCPLLLDFVSHKMQRSQNNFERHMWWAPQSLGTMVYFVAGVHDLHVAH